MPTRSTDPTFARLLVPALFAGLAVGCASSNGAEKSSSESTPTETQSSAQKPADDPAAEGDSPGGRSPPEEQGSEPPTSASGDQPTAGESQRIPDAELEEFIRVSRRMRKIEMKARRKIQEAQSKAPVRISQRPTEVIELSANSTSAYFSIQSTSTTRFRPCRLHVPLDFA